MTKEEILPSPIKPEYKDIPDDEYVLITEGIKKEHVGVLKINKKGSVLKYYAQFKKWKPAKPFELDDSYIAIVVSINKTKKVTYYLHRLLAFTFLMNSNNYPIVDHIDRNRHNYSLSNLRWASFSSNKSNSSPGHYLGIIYIGENDSGDVVRFDPKIDNSFDAGLIQSSIHRKCKSQGYTWKKVNIEVEDRLAMIGKTISDLEFKQFEDTDVWVCEEGIFKTTKKGYTLGTKCSRSGRRAIRVGGKHVYCHTIVYKVFSGETLKKGEEIDHIDTDPGNNCYSNLRKVNHTENMRNPKTLEKLSKRVVQLTLDGNYLNTYESVNKASYESKIGRSGISSCCSGLQKSCGGYKWMYEEDYLKLKEENK